MIALEWTGYAAGYLAVGVLLCAAAVAGLFILGSWWLREGGRG